MSGWNERLLARADELRQRAVASVRNVRHG